LAIIAVSDLHLGFEQCDKAAFMRFLGKLQSDPTVTDLVFIGDMVDMWRRDASGIFLENHDILDLIIELQKKMKFYYVAGNHDFHLLRLQRREYPISFLGELTIQQAGVNCRFIHGWEFDRLQRQHFMESLCHAMSDNKGDRDTNIWASLTRDESDLGRLFSAIGHIRKRQAAALLQLDPQQRLDKENLHGVEKKADSTVKLGEVLVFGHTHRPFINKAENIANTGSWLITEPIHNTFVQLEGGKPRLFVFEGAEITERVDI
jgi:UDP-2,3-diacylglucosamine pyrophosphatase LpxH